MDSFDLYLAYIAFDDNDYGKVRPTIIVEISELDGFAQIVPIYSKKDYWNDEMYKKLYEIQDWSQAGLSNCDSFANLDEFQDYPIEEVQKFKKIGHLSSRDIDGLLDALEEYYR